MEKPSDKHGSQGGGFRIRFDAEGRADVQFVPEPPKSLPPTGAIVNMTYDPTGSGPVPPVPAAPEAAIRLQTEYVYSHGMHNYEVGDWSKQYDMVGYPTNMIYDGRETDPPDEPDRNA